MELQALLRPHGFMRTEAPTELWEADTQDEPFLRMLGEMIAIGLGRGNDLAELVLNVSNVTVEPDEDPEERTWADPGDYVAISVRGAGTWDEDVWRAGQGPTKGLLDHVGPAADAAGAVVAYTRDLGGEGSVTALVPRLHPADAIG
jgi:hypothetical protein